MAPRIYLLGRPSFDSSIQRFLDDFLPADQAIWRESVAATAAERIVEFAGRVCYMSFGSKQSARTNAEYISHLISSGHESVLEHAAWTFAIAGVSRAFTHQLVRHRVGFAFSQLSQQYHDESDTRFVRPVSITDAPEVEAIWKRAIHGAQSAYKEILSALDTRAGDTMPLNDRRELIRAIRSAARSVLPNATETAIVVTANARAVRHFLKTRGNIVGDTEMRLVATRLLEQLRPEGPALFADFVVKELADGLPIVVHNSFDK